MAPELFSPVRPARIPPRVSHYEIKRKLGQGGMGVVYQARDLDLERWVALKFIAAHIIGRSPERIARFRHEACAISKLNHPHIATIFAIEDTGELQFLVLEYLPGGTLREKLAARKTSGNCLPQTQAIVWGIQLAEGLAHAHRHGVVHRDVKPSNVLFTEEGRVKLADFGLAKMLAPAGDHTGEGSSTGTGRAVGTPVYMSPEQARGIAVDERSDVFSLGVLLFEMLAGEPPFHAPDTPALLHEIVYSPAPDLRGAREGVDPGLAALVAQAMEKDPARRYRNAGEMAHALRLLSADAPADTALSRAETVTLPKPAARQSRPPLGAMVALAAGIALVSVTPQVQQRVASWTHPIPAEKRIAVLLFANVGGDAANQPLADGLMETVSNSLTRLEQFHGALTVAPASDVRKEGIASARDAGRVLGANLAITGSVERIGPSDVQVLINLVDTRTVTQLRTETIRARLTDLLALQDGVVQRVSRMLELVLLPQATEGLKLGTTVVPAAYPHYIEGLGYLRRYDRPQNVDNAIAAFRRALAIDPKYVLAYAGAARAYWRKYDLSKDPDAIDAALENGSRALALNDQLATVHITMGMVRAGKGQYELAEREMRTALQLDPLNADAYRELASTYEAIGRAADAEQTYRRAIELRKDDWWSLKQLGVFYFNSGRYAEAEPYFREVIKLTPDSARAYSNLGGVYLKLGRTADAAAQFEQSLRIEPNASGYSNLGSLYYFDHRYAQAVSLFEKSVALTPADSKFWMNLADAYRWTPAEAFKAPGTYRHAIDLIQGEIAINPHDAQLRSKLATAYAALGERQEAISEIEKALPLAPGDGFVHYRAALVYEQLHQRERALRELEAALDANYALLEISNAPPFDRLREDPRFQRLLSLRRRVDRNQMNRAK